MINEVAAKIPEDEPLLNFAPQRMQLSGTRQDRIRMVTEVLPHTVPLWLTM